MNKARFLILIVSLALIFATIGPLGFIGTTEAVSTSVTLQKALDDQQKQTSLSYTFTASDNGTIDVTDSPSSGDANVDFDFSSWSDQNSGSSGSSSSWSVTSGHEYTVTYTASVSSGASGGTDGTVDGTSYISGPSWKSSETLTASIDYEYPSFGYIDSKSETGTFEGESQLSRDVSVSIPNTGNGVMVPSDMRFSGTPSGISVSANSLPNQINGGDSGTTSFTVTVDDSVTEGTHYFDVTVEDNLGNTEQFSVGFEVIKPPGVDVPSTIDVGDILVGESGSKSFEISEVFGYEGISGIDSNVYSQAQYGSLSISGTSYVSTTAGGSDTATAEVTLPNDAPQHSTPSWDVTFSPYDSDGVGDSGSVTARVIYPPYFQSLSAPQTNFIFDQPKESIDVYTKTVSISVENGGDLPMQIEAASASVSNDMISAQVNSDTIPSEIPGLSSREIEVDLAVDPEASEGENELQVEVSADTPGTKTSTATIGINHEVELEVTTPTMDLGDVPITQEETISSDIRERLGYQGISNVTITRAQETGPSEWLEVEEKPSHELAPGESADFRVKVEFPPNATVLKKYSWNFTVRGNEVENQSIIVTGRPELLTYESTLETLHEQENENDWAENVAGPMAQTLTDLEAKLKSDTNTSRQDLPTFLAAARSTIEFIEATRSATETIETDGYENASDSIGRAAAEYQLMSEYISAIDDPKFKEPSKKALSNADTKIDALVSQTRDHYQTQLSSEDVTVIEEARIKSELAQLALLAGNRDRAESLQTESKTAYENYTSLVSEGNNELVTARSMHNKMEKTMFVSITGQPLIINPATWDAFNQREEAILTHYRKSVNMFQKAGASARAQSTQNEMEALESDFTMARYSLYGFSIAYLLGFLALIGIMGRNVYAYIRDAREAVSGDFLV